MNTLQNKRPPEPFLYGANVLRSILNFAFKMCGGIACHQLVELPRTSPLIFCPNHISDCDPAAVFVTCPRRDLYHMAKSELFAVPILGPVLRAYGTFGVERGTADRTALRKAESYLKQGNCLVMFGEGKLSQEGTLLPIKPGIAVIALRTGASIVPVGLVRTDCVMPYANVWPQHSDRSVRVVYGKPISMDCYAGMRSKVAIPLILAEIERGLRDLTGQSQA